MSGQIDWRNELGWIKKYRFPLSSTNSDYGMHLYEWIKEYCEYIDSCKSLCDDKKEKIKKFAFQLLECHKKYLECQFSEAYSEFNHAMDSVQKQLLASDFGMRNNYTNIRVSHYYRLRKGKESKTYLEMLHIPLARREKASAGRFSVPGMPCSYLASAKEICWYECGMPQNFQLAEYKTNYNPEKNKKLLRLDVNPLQLIEEVLLLHQRECLDGEHMKLISEQIFFVLPLVAACSVSVEKRNDGFIEEYVIPQMLMVWVQNSTDFIGVRYYSNSKNVLVRRNNGHNVAIPVRDENNKGYSNEICSLFNFSETTKSEAIDMIEKLNEKYGDEIKKVEEFFIEISYEYQHFKSENPTVAAIIGELYQEYCRICESFLALLAGLSTAKGEGHYAIVLTLVKMRHWGELIKKCAAGQIDKCKQCAEEYSKRFNDDVLELMNTIYAFFINGVLW